MIGICIDAGNAVREGWAELRAMGSVKVTRVRADRGQRF